MAANLYSPPINGGTSVGLMYQLEGGQRHEGQDFQLPRGRELVYLAIVIAKHQLHWQLRKSTSPVGEITDDIGRQRISVVNQISQHNQPNRPRLPQCLAKPL